MTGHDQSLQPAEIGVSTTLVTLAALAVSISLVGRIRKLWYPDCRLFHFLSTSC